MKHSRLLVLFALAVPWLCNASGWIVHERGYGPVHAGMPIRQAERLLGTSLYADGRRAIDPWCDHVSPEDGHKGVYFMVEEGLITHAIVGVRGIASDAGVKVGDPASKVRRFYGRHLRIEGHKYTDGFYYFAWLTESSGIKYEIDERGMVEAIYGGNGVTAVEGCA